MPEQVVDSGISSIQTATSSPEFQNLAKSRLQEFTQATLKDSASLFLLSEASQVDLSAPNIQPQVAMAAFLLLRRQCPTVWDIGATLQGAEGRLKCGQGQTIRAGAIGTDPQLMGSIQRGNTFIGKFAQEVYEQYSTPVSDRTKNVILGRFNTWASVKTVPDEAYYVREMAVCAASQNLTQQDAAVVLRGIENYKRYNFWPLSQYGAQEQARYARFNQALTRLQLVLAGHVSGGGHLDQYESLIHLLSQSQAEVVKQAELVRPESTIGTELSYWENSIGNEGGLCLVDRVEMQQRYTFAHTERGRFVYYTATNQNIEPLLNRFDEINRRLAQTLGTDGTKPVHVVLVPEAKYCPRGGYAKLDGTGFILASSQDLDQVYAHEAVHANLAQIFGTSHSATATEGAAMYLARVVNPYDKRNDYVAQRYGDDQIIRIRGKGGQIGLSNTQMLDNAGEARSKADYEYAYKFGGLLAEFIVSRVGIEGYLQFYKRTCLPNLYDSDTGKQLVANGKRAPGVGEREINAQALKAMAALTGRPDMRPENVLQEFTDFAAARNAKGAFYR
ncbi:MAG: hypothetical protein A2782_00065 [Candidatus Blackburnbacteria bacterium RIFCSPHIGHO2_01_FULL_43_15b]|uniref:Uncharacterized protein n=1 Tax=Candidatus Blackburnbacteria bacterium RIFCSPHIGHO2_01_FULL_43_15b TaxID=1797513 RepID=A0A1G1V131_9BACT|nr:MAG: hypothetical protein A2782_00065 [Candidatus Blackburnbacteria bacterium RIFCSPHIGHO2_01_FULL_43_15b]